MPNVAARRLHLPPGTSRRPIPRWIGPLGALAIAIVLGAVFGLAYWHGYQLNREAIHTERERDALRRQNAQLREEIKQLHRPEYVERIAREQLGLVKPDEIAVIIVQPTPAPRATAEPGRESGGKNREPWWRPRPRELR